MLFRNEADRIVIISATNSFLAKSLISKLEEERIGSVFTHADIKEIEPYAEKMELVILFLSEELFESAKTLVYLKDRIAEKDIGLIVIGDDTQYDLFKKVFSEQLVTEFFERPLDLEKLLQKVGTYIEENTGEKRKKTVLVVDDDITYMRMVYEWLKESYHVGMASNGVQAISYLTKNKADLVLLDYEMPIADGPQVLSMLKNDTETNRIPVMFLTGHGDRDSVMSVIDLKPADYLLKTIEKDALLKKLETFFEKKPD